MKITKEYKHPKYDNINVLESEYECSKGSNSFKHFTYRKDNKSIAWSYLEDKDSYSLLLRVDKGISKRDIKVYKHLVLAEKENLLNQFLGSFNSM